MRILSDTFGYTMQSDKHRDAKQYLPAAVEINPKIRLTWGLSAVTTGNFQVTGGAKLTRVFLSCGKAARATF